MRLWKSAFALAAVCALGCGTGSNSPFDDPEANPEDYPALEVSDACGGKCDDPNAVLNTSPSRLLASLDMVDFQNLQGESESFALVGDIVLADGEEPPAEGATLDLQIAAVDGASNPDFKVSAQLVFDGAQFRSDTVDSSDLIPWQLMHIDVTGMHGDREINQAFEYAPGFEIGAEVLPELDLADPFEQALDVTLPVIVIDPEVPAPDYERANVSDFNLGGTEFWQRWPGGASPSFSYSAGTEMGRKCMYASARRFEAIMAQAPESMLKLKETTNWGGSFFNWNDDYSDPSASQRPRGAVLWAWRTSLVKWISQTAADGSCFLPTLEQVERAARNCQSKGDANDGEIEGCQAG